jgi:phytanoyl-CoA hydroxylase
VSPSGALTVEQVRLFRNNGYLKLEGQLCDDLQNRLRAAIQADVDAACEPVVRDEAGRVVRLSCLLERDAVFREAATDAQVLEPLVSLLGPHIEVVHNRHNHATLNVASRRSDTFHRDSTQWSRGLVTVIFYLEATDLDNGCTQVVPGTHLLPGVEVLHKVEEQAWVAAARVTGQAVPVPMPAGGLLAIDSLIFHRIGSNVTDGTRLSMTLGYRSVDDLAGSTVHTKGELVCGERIYRGNDGGPQ